MTKRSSALRFVPSALLIDIAENEKFKPGKTEHQGAKIEKAVDSLIKGLNEGIFNGFDYPIIYINVVTSASAAIDEATFLDKVDSLLVQGHIPRAHRDYFCYMDGRTSVSVWGQTFHELMRLMKGLSRKVPAVFRERHGLISYIPNAGWLVGHEDGRLARPRCVAAKTTFLHKEELLRCPSVLNEGFVLPRCWKQCRYLTKGKIGPRDPERRVCSPAIQFSNVVTLFLKVLRRAGGDINDGGGGGGGEGGRGGKEEDE